MTSIEPPFTYNPISKPKKSILKQQAPAVSNSWLSKFSSPDNTATTAAAATTQSPVQTPPQKTFGLLRKFINNVNNSQPVTTTTTTTNNKSKNDIAQTDNNIDSEELSSTELRRVRFSVNKLTVEYFPYINDTTGDIEESQENEKNMENNKEASINKNKNNDNNITHNNSNTNNSSNANNNNDNKNACKNDTIITPRKVLAYYELACKNKEEPMIESLVSTLMMNQQATYLTHIDLTNSILTNRILDPLADVLCLDFGLESLTLKNCNLEDEGIKTLFHSLLMANKLKHLNLADNSNIRTNGFKYISIFVKNAINLVSLDLCGTLPDKKAMYYISQALSSLDKNNSLERLLLDNCNLRQAQLEYLSNAIRKTKISYLSLCRNRFISQGGISIGVMLRDYDISTDYSYGLQQLILDYNEIRQDVQYIAQALRRNQNLKKLSMVDCKLDSSSCVLISEALKYNQSLKILNLSSNPLCTLQNIEGINALKQALYANRTLIELNISDTSISTEGAIAIAECLPENNTLCRLDLSQNVNIDLAGLMALLSGIKLNSTLMFLDLSIPALDREMVKVQNEIVAICTRNTQHNDKQIKRTSSLSSNDNPNVITTTQATARLSLQERLAAVTKGKNSRPGSLRSVDSTDNLRPTLPSTTTAQESRGNRLPTIQTNFDTEISQVGLLEDMLRSEEQTTQTKNNNVNPIPNEVIMQVYFQSRKALASLNNSIPHLMESDQLCTLLELNDRLTSAIARYEEIYYSKKGNQTAPNTISTKNETENNQIEDTTVVIENNENKSSSFRINDDIIDDDIVDDDDDEILVPVEEDDDDVDNLKVDHVANNDDNNADIHELRKKIEIEEGEAFKHSKDTDSL